MALVNHVTTEKAADGSKVVYGRITLDTQAHLYVTLTAANGTKLLLLQKGSRVGWWLQGKPAKTLQALQLQPGALPFRLRIPAAQLRAKGRTPCGSQRSTRTGESRRWSSRSAEGRRATGGQRMV